MHNSKNRIAIPILSLVTLFCSIAIAYATETDSGSGGHDGHILLVRLLLILAITKIAQRVDSYLNTLGLSAAQGGSDLLGAIIAGSHMLGHGGVGGGKGGAIGSILGKTQTGMAVRNALGAAARAPQGEKLKAFGKSMADNNKTVQAISRGFQAAKYENGLTNKLAAGFQTAVMERARNSRAAQTMDLFNKNGINAVATDSLERFAAAAFPAGTTIAQQAAEEQKAAFEAQKAADEKLQLAGNDRPGSIMNQQPTGQISQDVLDRVNKAAIDGKEADSRDLDKVYEGRRYDPKQGLGASEGEIHQGAEAGLYGIKVVPDNTDDGYMYEGHAGAAGDEAASHYFNEPNYVKRMDGNAEAMSVVSVADQNLANTWKAESEITGRGSAYAQKFMNTKGSISGYNSTNSTVTTAADAAYGEQLKRIAQENGVSINGNAVAVRANNQEIQTSGGKTLAQNSQTVMYMDQDGNARAFKLLSRAELYSGTTGSDGTYTPTYSEEFRKQCQEMKLEDGSTAYVHMCSASESDTMRDQIIHEQFSSATKNNENSAFAKTVLDNIGNYSGSNTTYCEAAAAAYTQQTNALIKSQFGDQYTLSKFPAHIQTGDIDSGKGTSIVYNLNDGNKATVTVVDQKSFSNLPESEKAKYIEFKGNTKNSQTTYAKLVVSDGGPAQTPSPKTKQTPGIRPRR